MSSALRKAKSLFSTTLSASIGTGTGETITLASATGLPTTVPVTLTLDRVDANGVATPSKMERITGTISGTGLTSYTRGVDGSTEQAHSSGCVIEYIWNAADWNDLIDNILVGHTQAGAHKPTQIIDANDNEEVKFVATTDAVNELTITNAATTTSPSIAATGGDTNIDVKIAGKGTGHLQAYDNTSATYFDVVPNSSMSRQAVQNSNFDVWQRGTSVAIPDNTGTFLADRWQDVAVKDGGTAPTLTRSREALTPGELSNSYYFTRLTTNGAGTSLGANSYHYYQQKIEHGTRFLCGDGKTVTLTIYARSSISNKKMGIQLIQEYGTGGSPTAGEALTGVNFTLSSNLTKYTYTFTTNTLTGKTFGTANDDRISLRIYDMWGTSRATLVGADTTAETYVGAGTIDIAQVQLCAGDVALPFQPKSFEEELRACQRYYEKSYGYTVAPGTNGSNVGWSQMLTGVNVSAPNYQSFYISFKVTKRSVTPTITTYDFLGASGKISTIDQSTTRTNGVTPTGVDYVGDTSFVVDQANTNEAGVALHWTADAEL